MDLLFLWNKVLIACLKMSSPQLINTAFDSTFLSLHKSPMVVFVLHYTVFVSFEHQFKITYLCLFFQILTKTLDPVFLALV